MVIAFRVVVWRWITALLMLWHHRRTLWYLARKGWWKNLRRFVFVTFFVRGEDCGKGVIDWVYKLTGCAPYLWDIEVEVTTRCYLQCIHCEHTFFPDDYKNQDLSFNQLRGILDAAPNLKWINLTGEGSPFLNKEFLPMVAECKRRGIYVDFSHDFARSKIEDMRELILLGVERVYWSMDAATRDTYERIRVGADFKQTINNVTDLLDAKTLLQSPLPLVCVRYCFFNENIHELPHLIPLLDAMAPARVWGDRPAVNIVALLDFDETRHMVAEVPPALVKVVNRQASKAGWEVYWSHITHNENQKPPASWCTFWSEPYIMIDGSVVPCCGVLMSNKRDFLTLHSFGNINDQSLKEIWNDPIYREFRQVLTMGDEPIPAICDGCRVFNTQKRRGKGIWNEKRGI